MGEHDTQLRQAKSDRARFVDHEDHVAGKATAAGEHDGRQGGWDGKAYRGTMFGGATLPWAASPKAGIEVLEAFVAATEAKVGSMTAKRLDTVLAPDAVIATVAISIAEEFERLEVKLATAEIEATQATALLARLDSTIGRLFTLARQHRVRMRESGLEYVFDREDNLRLTFSYPRGRANRAEMYYDANLGAGDRKRGAAPDASAIVSDLSGDTDALSAPSQPENRDELIRQIESLGHALAETIKLAYEEAQQVILEPSAPRKPDLLEELATLAATLILSQASGILGTKLGAFAKVIDQTIGASFQIGKYATRQVGAKMARSMLAGFNAAGTEAVTAIGKMALKRLGEPSSETKSLAREPEDAALSARSVYLKAARRGTVDRAIGIHTELSRYHGELKRLPIDTLQAIARSFGPAALDDIGNSFKSLIVREWVNFGKRAMEQGEDVRDEAHKKAPLTKLDNLIAPNGMVRIVMRMDERGGVAFERAELPGVSDAVLDAINQQKSVLATIQLSRRIELKASGDHLVDPGSFDVDEKGTITVGRLSGEARLALAALANPVFTRDALVKRLRLAPSDADVLGGMRAILERLSSVCSNQIVAVS